MFERRPLITACATKLIALAAMAGALVACNSTSVQGEASIANEALVAQSNENWPSGSATHVYPLVTIVGPPGAISCGLTRAHRSGVPWTGAVGADRTVTIGLPSIYDRRNYSTTVRYQCLVASPDNPQGEIIVRDVPDIEFPLGPEARDARFRQQLDYRARSCAERPDIMREFNLTCNLAEVAYIPERRLQPKLIHVGEPDAEAPARWARLRADFEARCDQPERRQLCALYDDVTWTAMQRADLGSAPSE